MLACWGSKGDGIGQFTSPSGIAVDPAGLIYVADYGNNRVEVYEPTRKQVSATTQADSSYLGGRTLQTHGLASPEGMDLDAHGNAYVVDRVAHRAAKLSSDGRLLASWGEHGSGPGQFDTPADIAAGPGGDIYIVDMGNHRVQQFDRYVRFVRTWGTKGTGPGQFQYPTGITVCSIGRVHVADSQNGRVQVFAADGEYMYSLARPTKSPGTAPQPRDVVVDDRGLAYVIDYENVVVFDTAGDVVREWTYQTNGGTRAGPAHVALDTEGSIYIADSTHGDIREFDAYGKLVNSWTGVGGGRSEGRFISPSGIAVGRFGPSCCRIGRTGSIIVHW